MLPGGKQLHDHAHGSCVASVSHRPWKKYRDRRLGQELGDLDRYLPDLSVRGITTLAVPGTASVKREAGGHLTKLLAFRRQGKRAGNSSDYV